MFDFYKVEYVIHDIKTVNGGSLRDVHKGMMHKHCRIDVCEVNHPAYLTLVADADTEEIRRIRTSPVVSISTDSYRDVVSIKTMNTIYTLIKASV